MNDALRHLWRQWCFVVRGFAFGEAPRVDDQSYKALHRNLLSALRDQDGSGANSSASLLGRMQSLIEPWLALGTFATMDRRTLVRLWRTCLETDQTLVPPRRSSFLVWGTWAVVFALIFILLGSSLLLFKDVLPLSADVRKIQSQPLLFVPLLVVTSLVVLGIFALASKLLRRRDSEPFEE
jgi:hypothetical protein